MKRNLFLLLVISLLLQSCIYDDIQPHYINAQYRNDIFTIYYDASYFTESQIATIADNYSTDTLKTPFSITFSAE